MAVFKMEKNGKITWASKFRYETWNGEIKQKKKEGFATRREAVEWEKTFLGTCKTDVSCLRQSGVQELGKAVTLQDFIGFHYQFHIQIVAGAVCFVRNTDDVLTGTEFTEFIGKLLDGGQIHAAAGSFFQHCFQSFPAVHLDHGIIADELFGVQELGGKLII